MSNDQSELLIEKIDQTDLGSMGFFGIFKEAYKITISFKKVFSQVTLALLLPLSILNLSHIQISNFIQTKTYRDDETSKSIAFLIAETIYMLLLFTFSVFSTSSIAYIIACIYTSKEITFDKALSVVYKVWKRLTVTFLCCFLIVALYTGFALGIVYLFAVLTLGPEGEQAKKVLIFIICLSIPYFIGLAYIKVFWHLASVISVLEKCYGIKALKKSMSLIKGKLWVSLAIFTTLEIFVICVLATFSMLVVYGYIVSTVGRVGVGILCYLLLPIYFHFAFVIQTVIYLVCKSYHHEAIDKLVEGLDVSSVPLGKESKDKDDPNFD